MNHPSFPRRLRLTPFGQLPFLKGSFGSTSAGHSAPSTLVKSDANNWSSRMQIGGQVHAITHGSLSTRLLAEFHLPAPVNIPFTFLVEFFENFLFYRVIH